MADIKRYLAEIGRRGGLKGGKARMDSLTPKQRKALTKKAASGALGEGEERAEAMKAAIYARVSTNDQRNEIQVRELTEYVARRGWELAGVYQDTMSGAKARRPGLDALMADARLRKFDAVLVWKLDRFGRSLVNCVHGIQELSALHVRFIAVSQGLDTDASSPTSRLLLHILAAVSEFERELIRERVRAGVANAKKNGKALGRPKAIFDRHKAIEMRAAGMSFPQIAKLLGVGQGTVVRAIAGLSKKATA